MATCEKCNATFTPSTDATEVTSARILCPKCEAERRAERQRRAAAAAQPAGAKRGNPAAARESASPAAREGAPPSAREGAAPSARESVPPSARESAPPVPALKRPVAGGSKAAAARTPAAAESARPGSGVRAGPSARSAKARSTGLADESAHEPKHKPIPGAKGQATPIHPDVRREAELLRQRANKTMTYAWIVCGILTLIAGGVWFKINLQKQHERELIEAQQKRTNDFLAKMKGFNLDVAAQAEEAIKTADSDKFWKDTEIAGEVGGIVSKATAVLDLLKDRKEVDDRLTNAELVVRDYASKSAEDLARVRRTLDDLEGKGDMMGDEFKKRVAEAKTTVDRAYITRLHDEAKAQAAGGTGNARVALTAYTKAEEEVLKLFEKNIRSHNKEAEEYFKGHYLAIIKESDALAQSLFTPEEIAKTPWKDLLAEDQKTHWQQYAFKGWRITNGVLEAAGPEAGSGKDALMAVPEAGGYRDFQLECEFTVVKGAANFCFRLGKRVDRQVEQYLADAGPKSTAFKAGETYTMLVTFVGSKITIAFTPSDIPTYENEERWDITRKGAFGVTLGEGSEIKITRLRIRELR
jgi:hypothetical protein